MNVHTTRKQRGFTLTEALVSFAITASGLLVIASFQAGLFSGSAYSKARTEALSLAQQKIEQFRHYTHASDANFIDDNGDGIMDADATYTDAAIVGQNATFTRTWALSTSGRTKKIDVTVSWRDRANDVQSVMLATQLAWISPRVGVDQLAELAAPLVPSPTGRAMIGDGNLADFPAEDLNPIGAPDPTGLRLYQHKEDLLLINADDKILLTLLDACLASDGTCEDFVRISGTVYVDKANTSQKPVDIHVIAADAAHCERWVPEGHTLTSPPATPGSGDYLYYNYTCYLGGGWHGNIGFVTAGGLQQNDKICQGDPTAQEEWARPVIALRRAYRGMLSQQQGGKTVYFTQGIKDAATLTGHDFVFTKLPPSDIEGTHCMDPMTRADSSGGSLFEDVPTAFFCLNTDHNGDSVPDYLDSYDTTLYAAGVSCPFDPTDQPVRNHHVSGTVYIASTRALELSHFGIVTSDGPGNCQWTSDFASTTGGYQAAYSCDVYDWGSGWTGFIQLKPNSDFVYCPSRTAPFSAVKSDVSQNFACNSVPTVTIEGALLQTTGSSTISSIAIIDSDTGSQGSCEITTDTSYSCLAPYNDNGWNGTLTVTSSGYVCDAAAGVFTFLNYTDGGSPYIHNIVVAQSASQCPQ